MFGIFLFIYNFFTIQQILKKMFILYNIHFVIYLLNGCSHSVFVNGQCLICKSKLFKYQNFGDYKLKVSVATLRYHKSVLQILVLYKKLDSLKLDFFYNRKKHSLERAVCLIKWSEVQCNLYCVFFWMLKVL